MRFVCSLFAMVGLNLFGGLCLKNGGEGGIRTRPQGIRLFKISGLDMINFFVCQLFANTIFNLTSKVGHKNEIYSRINIDRLVESQTYYWRAENYDQYNKQDMIGKGYRVLGDLRCSNVVRKVVNIPDWLIKSLRDAGCTIGKFKCAIESDYVINSTYTLIRICYIEGMNICDQVSHQAIHDNAERVLRLSKN